MKEAYKSQEVPLPGPSGEKPTTTPYNAFLEHQKTAIEEAGKAIEALIPEAARDHGSTAIKEIMASYRVLLDAVLDEVSASRMNASRTSAFIDNMPKKIRGKNHAHQDIEIEKSTV